jgi:hypothetical protein
MDYFGGKFVAKTLSFAVFWAWLRHVSNQVSPWLVVMTVNDAAGDQRHGWPRLFAGPTTTNIVTQA